LDFWQTNGIEDPAQLNGSIQFNGEFSSLGGETPGVSAVSDLADLELVIRQGVFYTKNPIVNHLVGGRWISVFAQDNIIVSPNLSVDIGLRWNSRRQPMDKNNEIAAFFSFGRTPIPLAMRYCSLRCRMQRTMHFVPTRTLFRQAANVL